MPIYDFECSRCHQRREEIQRYDDPAPHDPDLVCPASEDGAPKPCEFTKAPTTFVQRWRGDYSNDGRGGWVRQGEAMVRQVSGTEKTKYGEGA